MGYITGDTIKKLREKRGITQKELADKIGVSDKTVSKWETGRGLPDIGIIEDLSATLNVSLSELFTGEFRTNNNVSGNVKRIKFYVCPICGNIITALGESAVSCCGVNLPPQIAEPADEKHEIHLSTVEDEYLVTLNHQMSKEHYISFVALVTSDSCEVKKLYPEQDICVRFKRKGDGDIYAFCNIHGLSKMKV